MERVIRNCWTVSDSSSVGLSNHGLVSMIAKWFSSHKHEFTGFYPSTMGEAATSGHFEMLKWLHVTRCEGWQRVMDGAAGNNHFEIVEWLHTNRSEGRTGAAMDSASSLEMIQWLNEKRTEGCTNAIILRAVFRDDFQLVVFLFVLKKLGTSFVRTLGHSAVVNRHFEVLQMLHDDADPNQVDLEYIKNWNEVGCDAGIVALLARRHTARSPADISNCVVVT